MCLLFSVLLAVALQTQDTAVVDPQPGEVHRLTAAAPIYPPIAKAAHIAGTVKLAFVLDPAGHVTAIKPVSGPPMLIGAAEDAVKQWTYSPIVRDGKPISANVQVEVSFALPGPVNTNNDLIAKQYFPASESCRNSRVDGSSIATMAELCASAAKIAEGFSTDDRFIERRSAFTWASGALLRNNQTQEALDYANKAVAVVQQGHDDGSGSSAAYSQRGYAEVAMGDFVAADRDLSLGEDFERKAIKDLQKDAPELVQHEYVPTLKRMLHFHASLLDRLGHPEEAKAKETEAASL